jgi:hypothetical protein
MHQVVDSLMSQRSKATYGSLGVLLLIGAVNADLHTLKYSRSVVLSPPLEQVSRPPFLARL